MALVSCYTYYTIAPFQLRQCSVHALYDCGLDDIHTLAQRLVKIQNIRSFRLEIPGHCVMKTRVEENVANVKLSEYGLQRRHSVCK